MTRAKSRRFPALPLADWAARTRRGRHRSGDLRVAHVFGVCTQATCRRYEQRDGRRQGGRTGVERAPDRHEPTDHADARTADDLAARVEQFLRRQRRCPYAWGNPGDHPAAQQRPGDWTQDLDQQVRGDRDDEEPGGREHYRSDADQHGDGEQRADHRRRSESLRTPTSQLGGSQADQGCDTAASPRPTPDLGRVDAASPAGLRLMPMHWPARDLPTPAGPRVGRQEVT